MGHKNGNNNGNENKIIIIAIAIISLMIVKLTIRTIKMIIKVNKSNT